MEEAHLVVQGRVQGVFYRSFVQRAARLLGLPGFAKNLENGDVEIVVQGPRETVDELITRCYDGPSGAQIDDIQVHWREAKEQFKRFEIR
jgi:acylphosphatase